MSRPDVVPLDDLSPTGWLVDQLSEFGGRVGNVVPPAYEAFARILHRCESGPDDGVRWADVADHCGTTMHPLAQYRMLAGLDPRSVAVRRWPDAVEPDVGSLDRRSVAALRDVLVGHTTPERCWFALWEGWGGLPDAWHAAPTFTLPGRSHHLFSGRLSDVVDVCVELACAGIAAGGQGAVWFALDPDSGEPEQRRDWAAVAERFRSGPIQSPSLWWPEDRSWCVGSEIDFDSTLVAGSAALVAELIDHPGLEAFRVDRDDSLQHDGDRLNMR